METKVIVESTKVEKVVTMYDNDYSRKGKESVKSFFRNFEKQIALQWKGLKEEETAFKALNNVIAGIAGGQNEKPEIWLLKHFSRYIDKDGNPCNPYKVDGQTKFRRAVQSGATARGLLQKAALNCIESNRIGNRFQQFVVEPTK